MRQHVGHALTFVLTFGNSARATTPPDATCYCFCNNRSAVSAPPTS